MLLALVVAFGAGVASFVAPCTVPLLPAYVGVLSGANAGVAPGDQPRRLLVGSLAYVAGFTAVFVALGLAAGAIGRSVRDGGGAVQRVGGAVVLLLATLLLVEAVSGRPGVLARLSGGDRGRGRLAKSRSAWAPFLLGIVFGTAFTPCVGPILGSVLVIAADAGGALKGGVLLAAYALGIGLPFVIAALLLASSPGLARRLTRWSRRVAIVGGVLLLLLGVALVTGEYARLTSFLARYVPAVGA
jgi:cytochrome c-type biogenesis protein